MGVVPKEAFPVPKQKYEMASLFTQIAFRLTEPRRYVTVDELAAELDIENRRKVQRWLAGLRFGVFNGVFNPYVLRLENRAGEEVPGDVEDVEEIAATRIFRVRLVSAGGEGPPTTMPDDLLAVYLAFTALRYLEGIVPHEAVQRVWRDLVRALGPDEGLSIASFEQKFYAFPFAPKRYDGCREILATVVDALVRQHVLDVRYFGLDGTGRDHRLEPWTLAMHKGGLYLVGRSNGQYETTLSVERIDQVEKVLDEAGEPVRFRRPKDYSPAKYFEGQFGILGGEETEVELEIQNRETELRLRERLVHPTQEFVEAPAGALPGDAARKVVLRMRVRGTVELLWWILGQGPYLKVLKPASLRDRVAREAEAIAALYRLEPAAAARGDGATYASEAVSAAGGHDEPHEGAGVEPLRSRSDE